MNTRQFSVFSANSERIISKNNGHLAKVYYTPRTAPRTGRDVTGAPGAPGRRWGGCETAQPLRETPPQKAKLRFIIRPRKSAPIRNQNSLKTDVHTQNVYSNMTYNSLSLTDTHIHNVQTTQMPVD